MKGVFLMFSDSRELKLRARARLRQRMLPILLVAAVYIVAGYLINYFASELSGANAYSRAVNELVNSYAGQVRDALNDPEQLQAVLNQIYASVPSAMEFFAGRSLTGPLLSVLVTMISLPLAAGYTHHILFESRKKDTSVGYLMHGFKVTFKTVAIGLLTGLAVALGSVFLVIPGVILSLMFSMSVMVLMDDPDKGAIACMKESARLMSGHKWRLFKLYFSFILWMIAANLVSSLLGVPLLNIYLTPYINLSVANFYNELIHYQPEPVEPIEF